jgi:hypothetical protein
LSGGTSEKKYVVAAGVVVAYPGKASKRYRRKRRSNKGKRLERSRDVELQVKSDRKSAVKNAINTMGLFPLFFGREKQNSGAAGDFMKKKQQLRKVPPPKNNNNNNNNKKKKVRFTPYKPTLHSYEFNWELEGDYWFSKAELKTFNEVRFDEADGDL